MPHLKHVASVLKKYRGRFDLLDAFADDIEELRIGDLATQAQVLRGGPNPLLLTQVAGARLYVDVFPGRGVARFRLSHPQAANAAGDLTARAALGGLLGTAIGAATKTKEGLLGGLVLGVLVGGAVGAASTRVERARTLRFDSSTGEWRLYHGPLLRWAKRTIQPAA